MTEQNERKKKEKEGEETREKKRKKFMQVLVIYNNSSKNFMKKFPMFQKHFQGATKLGGGYSASFVIRSRFQFGKLTTDRL